MRVGEVLSLEALSFEALFLEAPSLEAMDPPSLKDAVNDHGSGRKRNDGWWEGCEGVLGGP